MKSKEVIKIDDLFYRLKVSNFLVAYIMNTAEDTKKYNTNSAVYIVQNMYIELYNTIKDRLEIDDKEFRDILLYYIDKYKKILKVIVEIENAKSDDNYVLYAQLVSQNKEFQIFRSEVKKSYDFLRKVYNDFSEYFI